MVIREKKSYGFTDIETAKSVLRKLKYKQPLSIIEVQQFKKAGYIDVDRVKRKLLLTKKAKKQIRLVEEFYGGL